METNEIARKIVNTMRTQQAIGKLPKEEQLGMAMTQDIEQPTDIGPLLTQRTINTVLSKNEIWATATN